MTNRCVPTRIVAVLLAEGKQEDFDEVAIRKFPLSGIIAWLPRVSSGTAILISTFKSRYRSRNRSRKGLATV